MSSLPVCIGQRQRKREREAERKRQGGGLAERQSERLAERQRQVDRHKFQASLGYLRLCLKKNPKTEGKQSMPPLILSFPELVQPLPSTSRLESSKNTQDFRLQSFQVRVTAAISLDLGMRT